MCNWLKCELVTQLNFHFKIIICNLIEIFIIKNLLKNSISLLCTWGLKISKSPSINSTHWGHSKKLYPSASPNSLVIFSFELNEFSVRNCSILNNFFTAGRTNLVHHPLLTTHWELSNGIKSFIKGTMVNSWLTIVSPNSFGSLLSSFKCHQCHFRRLYNSFAILCCHLHNLSYVVACTIFLKLEQPTKAITTTTTISSKWSLDVSWTQIQRWATNWSKHFISPPPKKQEKEMPSFQHTPITTN